jgi:hypothetical protein
MVKLNPPLYSLSTPCKCGCGQFVTGWNSTLKQPHMWVFGHYMKTVLRYRKLTEVETRRRIRSLKETWARKRREGTNHLSEEVKEHMRQAQSGRGKGVGNPMYGRKHTEKTKLLMSEGMRRSWVQRKNNNL